MHSKPILSNNSINDTAAVSKTEWIEHHFRNRPVRRSFACLWEQTFYDPLTAFPFPPWASLALLFTVLIFIVIGSASTPDRTYGEGVLKKPQEEPKLRAQRRRQNWRPWIGLKIVWLRVLPLYSIVFAYVASVATQTAVEAGFLRLPANITEADWFENCVRLIKVLRTWIKVTNLSVVLFSLVFSETALTHILQALNQTRADGQTVEIRGVAVAIVTAGQLILWGASYAAVGLSALLLFASMFIFLVAQLPLVIYSNAFYSRLQATFLGRYLNGEIEKFFRDHEFLRVADDFKSLVLPFTALSFAMQINLLLCSHHLVLETRRRLLRYSLWHKMDLQLHLSQLWGISKLSKGCGERQQQEPRPENMWEGADKGRAPIGALVQDKLHSSLMATKVKRRNRRNTGQGVPGKSLDIL